MTQTLTDRCEALRSLLCHLYAHLWSLEKVTPKYGDSTPPDGPPSPVWATYQCDGYCPQCAYRGDCRGEGWERVKDYWIRAYRMDVIADAFLALEPYQERAVLQVYVDPYEGRVWEPGMHSSEPVSVQAKIMRKRVADDGVEAMARMIRGDIVGLGERKRPLSDQIVELRQKGFSYRAIQRMLGCSSKTIAATVTSKGTLVEYSVR